MSVKMIKHWPRSRWQLVGDASNRASHGISKGSIGLTGGKRGEEGGREGRRRGAPTGGNEETSEMTGGEEGEPSWLVRCRTDDHNRLSYARKVTKRAVSRRARMGRADSVEHNLL